MTGPAAPGTTAVFAVPSPAHSRTSSLGSNPQLHTTPATASQPPTTQVRHYLIHNVHVLMLCRKFELISTLIFKLWPF